MKSEIKLNILTFDELTTRIRQLIRAKINGGEFTERSLAYSLRVSQPQLHNVLKGARKLSPELADRVLLRFQISILDLIPQAEMWQFMDDKNPDWLNQAAKRKPPVRSVKRSREDRSAWRDVSAES